MRLRAHPNVVCLAEQRRRMAEQRRAADLTDEPVRFVMSVPPVEFIGWQTQPRPEPAERQGDAAPQGGQRSRLRRALGLLVDFLCLAVLSAGMIAVHLAWGEAGVNILVGVMAVVVIAITICRG